MRAARTRARMHVRIRNSNSPQSSIVSTMGLRPWIIIIRKTDVRGKGSSHDVLLYDASSSTEFHSENVEPPCNPVDCAITRQFANLCSQGRGKWGGGRRSRGKREMVGLTHTQRRHNCERRRVTRVGSRRSPWSLAAGYAFVQQAFMPSRCATYAIMNASVSPSPLFSLHPCASRAVRFNTSGIVDGFARTRYPPQGDERLLVGYKSVQFSSTLRGFVLCCR